MAIQTGNRLFLANQPTVPVGPFFIDVDGTNGNVAKHLVHNGLREELGLSKELWNISDSY